MTDFNRNNLDLSSSPYLLQHTKNPIHWQEWSDEVLSYARENQKLIFVSIGYSSCHWCHVMAQEAFSDQATADFLNEHFVSIKVDREQRPDIDEYFMNFISQTTGQGGWPLNAFVDPKTRPFFAGTYFPATAKHGMPPFVDVLQQIRSWYLENKNSIKEFDLEDKKDIPGIDDDNIDDNMVTNYIYQAFDKDFGGLGQQTKFPPHNTLLLLLNIFESTMSAKAKEMIVLTLDKMSSSGLSDHLQGGFFRYCVDRAWTIPHFEKMLYDQAMHLWVYSLAYKLFGRERDKAVIDRTIACLTETFSDSNGLFYSSHDADTDHVEGETYIWSVGELSELLDEDEFKALSDAYDISSKGNFEGKNHLLKKEITAADIGVIEKKLLLARNKRKQPFVDKKIVTSWNSLVGIGLLMASRYTGEKKYKEMAEGVFNSLCKNHIVDDELTHSSLGKQVQPESFLEDYASLLLFATFLIEETIGEPQRKRYEDYIKVFKEKLKLFHEEKDGASRWFSNTKKTDFKQILASSSDHPIPSAVSLVKMAMFRADKILQTEDEGSEFKYEGLLQKDFYNIAAMYDRGKFHEIHTPEIIDWKKIPINSVVIKDERYQDCTEQTCREYASKDELLNSFKKS